MWYPGLQSQLPHELWKKHLLYVEKLSIMAEALGLHECTLLSLFLKTLDFEKLKKNSCDLVVISLFYITKFKDISENIVLITNLLLTFCTIWRQKKLIKIVKITILGKMNCKTDNAWKKNLQGNSVSCSKTYSKIRNLVIFSLMSKSWLFEMLLFRTVLTNIGV